MTELPDQMLASLEILSPQNKKRIQVFHRWGKKTFNLDTAVIFLMKYLLLPNSDS